MKNKRSEKQLPVKAEMSFSFPKPENWSTMPMFSKIAYYRNQLDERFAPYVDKLQVKRIVKETDVDCDIAKVIRILMDPDDFEAEDIQAQHMVKATHGCGWNINMTAETTVDAVKKLLNMWNRPYNWTDEKQYNFIKPRFFIEEKIDKAVGGVALVYMFRCIHGNPITIGVKSPLSDEQNSYDTDWNPILPVNLQVEKPRRLDEMLVVASALSAPFEFVRIDLYYENDVIYFSEYTFTPSGGNRVFPMDLEEKYGRLW